MLPIDVGLIQKLSSSNTFLSQSSVWIFFWSAREQHQNSTNAQLRGNIAIIKHQIWRWRGRSSSCNISLSVSTETDDALCLKLKCYSTTLNTFKVTYKMYHSRCSSHVICAYIVRKVSFEFRDAVAPVGSRLFTDQLNVEEGALARSKQRSRSGSTHYTWRHIGDQILHG